MNLERAHEEEHEAGQRLILASLPASLLVAMLIVHATTGDGNPLLGEAGALARMRLERLKQENSRIYPVLVQQKEAPEAKSDQIRALSDVTAEGLGGITKKEGFHTLSPYDVFEPGQSGRTGASGAPGSSAHIERTQEKEYDRPGKSAASRRQERGRAVPGEGGQNAGKELKIPANYRFEQDFMLRYDSSGMLSIARQELAGFAYFQSMIRQIQETFAPPGLNYAYRDHAGVMINQPIKPQIVRVQFLLDQNGNVRDVKKISSLGQREVDEACLNTLRGQNFGDPPPEVFQRGNIFGIGFVFPAIRY